MTFHDIYISLPYVLFECYYVHFEMNPLVSQQHIGSMLELTESKKVVLSKWGLKSESVYIMWLIYSTILAIALYLMPIGLSR